MARKGYLRSPAKLPDQVYAHSATHPGQDPKTGERTESAILSAIQKIKAEHPSEPINIIGHSWGGTDAIRLANEADKAGIQIDLLVTIDPVTHGESKMSNRDVSWVNIYIPRSERGNVGSDWGDLVSWFGGRENQMEGATNRPFRFPRDESGNAIKPYSAHMGVLYTNPGGAADIIKGAVDDMQKRE